MRRIKVVPLEATGIYLVDAREVPVVKATRDSTGVGARRGLGVDAIPSEGAEVAIRFITHRHLHPELIGIR
jgi:hypothetical protein